MINKNVLEIKDMLRRHSEFYNQNIKDDMLGAYATKLVHIDLSIILKALDEIASSATKYFPSLEDIKKTCSAYMSSSKQVVDSKYESDLVKENAFYVKVKEQCEEFLGDKREVYLDWYYKKFFKTEDLTVVKKAGMTLKPFEKCAYFDLYDSKFDMKKIVDIIDKKFVKQYHSPKTY